MARATAREAPPQTARLNLPWLQGAACGLVLAFATPTALMLAVLLAPALACAAAEQGKSETIRAVALLCAAGSFSPLWRLWLGGDRMGDAIGLLSDPLTFLGAWGAGACGWAACQVLPVLLRALWNAKEAARGRAIVAEMARTREEWDLEDAQT